MSPAGRLGYARRRGSVKLAVERASSADHSSVPAPLAICCESPKAIGGARPQPNQPREKPPPLFLDSGNKTKSFRREADAFCPTPRLHHTCCSCRCSNETRGLVAGACIFLFRVRPCLVWTVKNFAKTFCIFDQLE